jgi:hypothetical protein
MSDFVFLIEDASRVYWDVAVRNTEYRAERDSSQFGTWVTDSAAGKLVATSCLGWRRSVSGRHTAFAGHPAVDPWTKTPFHYSLEMIQT